LNDTIEVVHCYWLTNENINGMLGLIKALHANKTLQVFDLYSDLSREILLALLDLGKYNENYLDLGISTLIFCFNH
jgi:hypothetical protein